MSDLIKLNYLDKWDLQGNGSGDGRGDKNATGYGDSEDYLLYRYYDTILGIDTAYDLPTRILNHYKEIAEQYA